MLFCSTANLQMISVLLELLLLCRGQSMTSVCFALYLFDASLKLDALKEADLHILVL